MMRLLNYNIVKYREKNHESNGFLFENSFQMALESMWSLYTTTLPFSLMANTENLP